VAVTKTNTVRKAVSATLSLAAIAGFTYFGHESAKLHRDDEIVAAAWRSGTSNIMAFYRKEESDFKSLNATRPTIGPNAGLNARLEYNSQLDAYDSNLVALIARHDAEREKVLGFDKTERVDVLGRSMNLSDADKVLTKATESGSGVFLDSMVAVLAALMAWPFKRAD
jgi:hypothetical protein